MSVSSRSAVAIHALTKLALAEAEYVSSADIADSLASNPVLVRRILGNLRDAGIVRSTEGYGGGWALARKPREITLQDAFAAVEAGPVLARHPHPPSDTCEVGRSMQALLEVEFSDAEAAMVARLRRTTIAHMADRVEELEHERATDAR